MKRKDEQENVMRVFLGAMMAATALSGAAQAETVVLHAGRVITDAAKPASGPNKTGQHHGNSFPNLAISYRNFPGKTC